MVDLTRVYGIPIQPPGPRETIPLLAVLSALLDMEPYQLLIPKIWHHPPAVLWYLLATHENC